MTPSNWDDAVRSQVRQVAERAKEKLIEHYDHTGQWLEVEELVTRILGRPAPPTKEK